MIFLSWLSYFVFGTTTRAAAFATAQILLGLLVGVGILLVTALFAPALGDFALGASVALFAGLLTLLEDRPPLNVIPAYYIGAVTLFASGLEPTLMSVVQLAVPVLVGFGFGWLGGQRFDQLFGLVEHGQLRRVGIFRAALGLGREQLVAQQGDLFLKLFYASIFRSRLFTGQQQ